MALTLREDYLLSAAIDFGTTYCGVMFSLKKDFEEGNRLRIWGNQQDNKGDTNSLQEPTTVLLDPERKFLSFGVEAEDTYRNLALRSDHRDHYYFRHFKMTLHRQIELTRYTEIEDINGRKHRAIAIFTMAIRFLKKRLLENIKKREFNYIHEHEIRWVLTVPAMWSEKAKQYMREAAKEAGIPYNQLAIALEPEVAAVYCKELSIQRKEAQMLAAFDPKSRYMVLDLGGGTGDVTLQEVEDDGTLKEFCSADGGDWGGVGIDKEFYGLLEKLLGHKVFGEFKHKHMYEWISMQEEFEQNKKKIKSPGADQNELIVTLPIQLLKLHKEMIETSLEDIVKSTRFKDQLELVQENKLVLKDSILSQFFEKTLKTITSHVQSIFNNTETTGVDTIVMVGGFADSDVVQHRIKKEFQNKKVIIPSEAGKAVLKGAVIFGHNPQAISARVSPCTYGLHTQKPYSSAYPSDRKEVINGKAVVKNVFDKHIEIGEIVYISKPKKRQSFYVIDNTKAEVFWKVYRSTKKNPLFCDDSSCVQIGVLRVHLDPDKSEKRELGVCLICRGTELEAEAVDKKTGKSYNATFDFLQRSGEIYH